MRQNSGSQLTKMEKIKISIAGFSHYNSYLIYKQWGYWHKHSVEINPELKDNFCCWSNDFFKEFLEEIEFLKANLKPINLKLEIVKQIEKDEEITTRWIIKDLNNPFLNDEGAVLTKTKESGLRYAKERFSTEQELLGGCIKAFLKSIRTGVACLPDWNKNKLDRYGYKWVECKNGKKRLKKFLVPRCEEVKEVIKK